MPKKKNIGFARLSRFEREEIARRGGKVAAKKKRGRPHRWTRAEAARAAKKGHQKTPGPRNPRKHWGQHVKCRQCKDYEKRENT